VDLTKIADGTLCPLPPARSKRKVTVATLGFPEASRVSKSLLTLTGDDRTHPLYVAYFKKKSLSEFKRPMLGKQLEAMKGWVPELMKSDIPTLVALAPEVESAPHRARHPHRRARVRNVRE